MENDRVLLEVRDLKKYFKIPKGYVHAVDGISFKLREGRTLGVVGESGCGKTTLGRVILRLYEPTAGEILYKGANIAAYTAGQMHGIRREMQMIFQDPSASLDPRKSVMYTIGEPLKINKDFTSRAEYEEKVLKIMGTVGMADRYATSFPHELDGGRRQRIGIGRALASNPRFIVCDEPVSALDVSIQAQVINLLMDLQDSQGLAYLFITHDLSVVRHISHEILVMYLGQCVEYATKADLFKNPLHPYTKGLLDAVPVPSLTSKKLAIGKVMKGELTSPVDPAPGCRFTARCPYACEKCKNREIKLREVQPNHFVACVLYE